jgi:pimeloyl-ACP methyl ester carboxylesterase
MNQVSASPSRLPRPDGHSIAYVRATGSTPGVVFLGGFTSDMTGTKAGALDAWCRHRARAFVRFDYLGHGRSSGRFEQGTIGRWVQDALAIIDQLTEGPQILIGSSMGGWIMLLAALARPDRIAGLLGIASAADLTEELLWKRFDADTRRRLGTHGLIRLPSDYNDSPYLITEELIEEGRGHLLLTDTIPLSCPIRLLHGMGDLDVPWQTSLRIAEQLAGDNVRLILIKDGDHRLSRPEDLALMTDTLAGLLNDLGTASLSAQPDSRSDTP